MAMAYINRYWAKTGDDGWHPVAYHSLDVAASMAELLRRRPGLLRLLATLLDADPDEVARLIVWMACLHDIGKYSHLFQHKAPDVVLAITGQTVERQSGYRHEDGSMAFWEAHGSALLKAVSPNMGASTFPAMTILFAAIAGHHGAPVNKLSLVGAGLPAVKDDMLEFAAACTEIIGPTLPRIRQSAARRASWLLAGITVEADWIGSNASWFPYAVQGSVDAELPDLAAYWRTATERAARAVTAAGMGSVPLRVECTLSDLFPKITSPTPLQAALGSLDISGGPGLCVVEDLTGSGKTEAALLLAQRMIAADQADGVYVALPTSATSNGMYGRLAIGNDAQPAVYRKFFESSPQPSLVLAHGARSLNDTYSDSVLWSRDDRPVGDEETGGAACSAWIADMARKSLLADVGVGTIDQAILAVLPNKYQSLRLAGLARKVVVLDEIHSYDSYMTSEICGLLRFLGLLRCPVIALSATLPQAVRQQLLDAYRDGAGWAGEAVSTSNAYPLVTWAQQDRPVRETEVGFREGSGAAYPVRLVSDQDEVIRHLTAAAENGCACWIRNTVDDAREAVAALQAAAPHLTVMLFHSRYCAGDRSLIETEILRLFGPDSTPEDRRGRIVVATQVVEQSLDLDFDAMVSDLAPIDSIIQRAGRLHRHWRGDRHIGKMLLIYGPVPNPMASGTWYSAMFPRAAWVYPIHSTLWLTASALEEVGELALRDRERGARHLIESVYGGARTAPTPITNRDIRRVQELVEQGVLGRSAVLNHRAGYDRTPGVWDRDDRTPTRLGAPERPVRLAVRTRSGAIVPWSAVGSRHQRWIRSTLSLPSHWATEIAEAEGDEIDRIRGLWPRHERHLPVIVADSADVANLYGIKGNGPIHIRYTPSLGAERVVVL